MFVQTQLHLFFKIIIISPWRMIVWGSVLLRRTVCGDIDWHWHHQSQLAWPWWWTPLRLSKRQSMSPQTFLLGTTLTRTIILHQLMIWLMGPNLLQNYNRLKFSFSFKAHLHPKGLAHRSCYSWISYNTKLFLSRFSLKILFLQSHLVENRP